MISSDMGGQAVLAGRVDSGRVPEPGLPLHPGCLRSPQKSLPGSGAPSVDRRSAVVIARFTDLGPAWHQRKADRDRKIRAHLRQLQGLGLDVTITTTAA